MSCYSHTILVGEAGDPEVVIRVPGERSWIVLTRGRTGARARVSVGGAGRGAQVCAPVAPLPTLKLMAPGFAHARTRHLHARARMHYVCEHTQTQLHPYTPLPRLCTPLQTYSLVFSYG